MMRALLKIALLALVLSMAACGGDTTDGSPSVPAATSSPDHTAEPGEPALTQVEGYEYRAAPAELDAEMAAAAEQTEQFYSGYSVHEVADDGDTVGYLVLFEATAEMAEMANANPQGVVGGLAGGIIGSGGAEDVEMTVIGGEDVALATGPDLSAFGWYHDNTVSVFMVEGEVTPEASAYVEAYLTQVNAS